MDIILISWNKFWPRDAWENFAGRFSFHFYSKCEVRKATGFCRKEISYCRYLLRSRLCGFPLHYWERVTLVSAAYELPSLGKYVPSFLGSTGLALGLLWKFVLAVILKPLWFFPRSIRSGFRGQALRCILICTEPKYWQYPGPTLTIGEIHSASRLWNYSVNRGLKRKSAARMSIAWQFFNLLRKLMHKLNMAERSVWLMKLGFLIEICRISNTQVLFRSFPYLHCNCRWVD